MTRAKAVREVPVSNRTDPKQPPNPRPDPAESAGTTGWLIALNSFLERAFLKADVDTGC
ncbi:MAG: hypothetical protein H6Q82_2139 [Deltaproteobacteria bacterium]|nr:hypothetical protein [Deltaproteobacteria bacterium]